MDFKYKSAAELSAMTPEEQEKYVTAKREYEDNKQSEAVKTQVAEQVKVIGDSLKAELKTANDALNEQKAIIEEQGKSLVALKTVTEATKQRTLAEVFKEAYDENVTKAVSKEDGGDDFRLNKEDGIRIETKATVSTDVMSVDTVSAGTFPTAGSTGVVNGTIRTIYGKLIGYFGPRIPSSLIMEQVDVMPMDNALLIVINETTIGTVSVTPECAVKPVVKMTFDTQTADANPVAAMWHTTTKLRRFFAALVNRMEQKFTELINKQVPEVVLAAIRAGATAFTPNAALNINDNPNNYDALGAVIATLENLDYVPNTIMMNPIAWRNMKQEKNAEGIYTLSNGQSIALVENGLDWGGNVIRYIKDPKLGVDEFIIGDLLATVKVGVDSQLMYFETDGVTDAQATTNLTGLARNIRTHVLEKFIAVILPTGARAGIVRDTFSNVKTLITAA